MNKAQIVVIGLGRFGRSLVRTLSELGHEVLGVDSTMKAVEDTSEFATRVVQGDATDEETLRELGVGDFDVGVVAIGTDMQSSILVTLLLKKLGVRRVISKAQNELHGEILQRVGADSIVFPERDTGVRVAHSLTTTPELVDYMQITPGYGVAKMVIPETLAGRQLGQMDLKGRYGVTPLILARGSELTVNPSRYETVQTGNVLVVGGPDDRLDALRTT